MGILQHSTPYFCTTPPSPLFLLPAPRKRLALPAPKIVGYLPVPKMNTAGGYMDSPLQHNHPIQAGDHAGSPLRHASVISGQHNGKARNVVRLEIAQTPENQARLADSFADLLRSIGPLLTMDDAYAVIERHNRIYHERRAQREAEHARYMAALNDWWNQYLAARDTKTRQALIAKRPSMLQAAEVAS